MGKQPVFWKTGLFLQCFYPNMQWYYTYIASILLVNQEKYYRYDEFGAYLLLFPVTGLLFPLPAYL